MDMERWINDYGDHLLRICRLYLRDMALAEDAVQDTFIRAWQKYDSFENRSSEKTWITKIAMNVCKNMLKSPWHMRVKVEDFEQLANLSKNEYEQINDKVDVINAVLKLKGKYRVVVILYYYEELSVKEIAEVLSEKESTIFTRLNRAKEQLGQFFDKIEKE